jgi:DNA transposition AAA+ family ATPase
MTEQQKNQIAERLVAFCAQKGSQNKAAVALGISSSTVSKLLANEWELINDVMWRKIQAGVGLGRHAWNVVETTAFKEITSILADAQDEALVFGITGDAGCGKTVAVREYERNGSDVYVLACSEYWNKHDFLRKLGLSMGSDVSGMCVSEMMSVIIRGLKSKDFPLVILDEADKLSDSVLYFFITLYNTLENHCGIVLIATNHLEKRIMGGVRRNKRGYNEIFSRIGRRFVCLRPASAVDITEVCRANGMDEKEVIRRVGDGCDGDLRRVRRLVFAETKKRNNVPA